MGWLDGRVALVTGGGAGIGRAVVERFLAEGARVGVLERVAARVEQLQAAFGSAIVAVQGDVTRLADNQHAVDAALRAFGQLDIFVGNAGVFDRFISLADLPGEQLSAAFDELFGVNVKGAILGAKAALPALLKTEGCMIFTASVAGFFPGGGGPALHGIEARHGGINPPTGLRTRPHDPGERRGTRWHTNRPAWPGGIGTGPAPGPHTCHRSQAQAAGGPRWGVRFSGLEGKLQAHNRGNHRHHQWRQCPQYHPGCPYEPLTLTLSRRGRGQKR